MTTTTTAERASSDHPTRRARAHREPPSRVDVAVIGSGLGGLVAATTLARRGLSVAVFESHYEAGGCATRFARGPKSARYHFDVGLHYIGDCGEEGTIPRILSELGAHVEFEPLDPTGFDQLVFPDLRFAVPADVDLYRDRLVSSFPSERRGIDAYVRLVKSVMRVTRMLERQEGRPGLSALARVALDGLRIAPHRDATLSDVLDGRIRDPRCRAVIAGQSGDYGLPPSRVSAMLHMGLQGHYFRGAYYPKGGGQVIADRLVEQLEAAGGAVHLRTPVEQILVEGGRAVGIRLAPKAGRPAVDVRADVVLSNADIRRTLLELIDPIELPYGWIRRADRFEMAAALFIMFLGIEGDLRDLGMGNHNIWQFDDYDADRFYSCDMDRRGQGPIAVRGCYVTSATLKDPSRPGHHAPSGIGNLEVMCLVPGDPKRWGVDEASCDRWAYKHGETYRARKLEVEEELVRRLEALYPGAASRIVYREAATPLTHRRFTGATDGTGYGLAATPAQFMKRRPGYRGPLSGLYFAGASTRAGHGIVGAMMGGQAAARRILADVRGEVRVSR